MDNKDVFAQSLLNAAIKEGVEKAVKGITLNWPLSSDFITNISYAFRSHLNAIIGFADLLADADISDEYKSCADSILVASNQLSDLINDYVDYIKLCGGQVEPVFTEMHLQDLLAGLQRRINKISRDLNRELIINIENALPELIRTDKDDFVTALANLADNAFAYTLSKPAELFVYKHKDDGSNMICFCFRDEGHGFEGDVNDVFSVDLSRKGIFVHDMNTSGFEVAVAKHLIELLGGRLEVGVDSAGFREFTAFIPCEGDVSKMRQPLETVGAGEVLISKDICRDTQGKKKILIADDDPASLKIAVLITESIGFEVDQATCGKDALAMAEKGEYGLILLDVWMSDISGIKVVSELRADGVRTPVMALTADVMDETVSNCMDAGFTDYIPKPIDRTSMRQILSSYFPDICDVEVGS